jgi:hypothetical protein
MLALARLHDFIAASAIHDSKERFPQPKCHPSTRGGILKRILNWVESDSPERIFWVSGSAGTGKSAIAQTVSELCKLNGRLAATFFFSRISSERNTNERLVATLAYQIALSVPGAKEFITNAVEDDPSVLSKDMNSQLFQLIIHPLTLAAQGWDSIQPTLQVVIIDALDECIDKRQQTDILSAICNAFMAHELPLRFLICSLPEHDIRMRFEQSDLQPATTHLDVDTDNTVIQDITTFLEKEFSRIHQEHRIQETPWPPEGVIQSLAERASGQFTYASTIVKFIDDRDFQPQQRLKMVLGTLPHGMCSPFEEIDLLYTQILDAVPTFKFDKIHLCLGIVIHIDCYSLWSAKFNYDIRCNIILPSDVVPPSDVMYASESLHTANLNFLNELLQLNSGGVEHLLRELHSVLDVQSKVSIRHKSFLDFLSCQTRSGGYYIDKEIVLAQFFGLFWATFSRWLNQFHNVPLDSMPRSPSRMWLLISCTNVLMTQSSLALGAMMRIWRILLPESRHARPTLQELAKIADFLEKNASDTLLSKIELYFEQSFFDFYPTVISWLSKEVCGRVLPIYQADLVAEIR